MPEALNRERFLAPNLFSKVERVDLPELGNGDCIFVRVMSGEDYGLYESLGFADGKPISAEEHIKTINARLVALAGCDEAGERIFKIEDIPVINKNWPGFMIDRVAGVAARINRLRKQDGEEASKNSQAAHSGGSG